MRTVCINDTKMADFVRLCLDCAAICGACVTRCPAGLVGRLSCASCAQRFVRRARPSATSTTTITVAPAQSHVAAALKSAGRWPDQHLKLSRTSAVQRSGNREQCHGHGRAAVLLDSLVGLRRFGHRIAPPRPVNPSPARPRPTASASACSAPQAHAALWRRQYPCP